MRSKKIDELFESYQSMKVAPLIIYGSGARILYWLTLVMVLPTYAFLFRLLGTGDMKNLLYCVLFIVPGIIFHLLAVTKSNKYVKTDTKFAAYRPQMKLRWWGYSYESFITEYRYDKIKSAIGHMHLNTHIDDVISILESDGTKLFEVNWKPVIILGAMLFPIIGEYIGFRYNITLQVKSNELQKLKTPEEINAWVESTKWHGVDTILRLLPLMMIFGLLVWFLVFLCEKLLLTKVENRKGLIKLLRLIKIG